ncbi:bactofilin family protein [Flavicella marina]|uniref:bactofilin family protein n=1 Tax=Flavicella marina TaxID=1475951 RepID=UPI001264E798|nr:polymer-forming cytoskeletal protein [Flavicella marina]
MFKEKKMKEAPVLERNVIGKKTTIVGDIHSEGDFRIDGTVEGSIRAEGRVIIGKDGLVKGLIECTNADIEGEVSGNISVSDMLTLKSTAMIQGEVVIGKLTVEPGASFNATCSMKGMVKELSKDGAEKTTEQTA